MGNRVATASPVNAEGISCVLRDQGDQRVVGCLHSQKGGKVVNQDSAVIYQSYGATDGVLCGVFDGHGKNGHLVSRFVKERLPLLLLEEKNAVGDAGILTDESSLESQATSDDDLSSDRTLHDWELPCTNAFEKMDEEIKDAKFDCSFSGTTAVVVLKQGNELVIANLGDSRAILGTIHENEVIPVQLTTDLKPGTPDEAIRIQRSNGRVFALKEEPDMKRAWLPSVYSPGMAMSRAFGDLVMKNYGIISTPVVTHHNISSDDLFIVVATDGIWDVLSNEDVTAVVMAAETEEMAAKAVVDAAAAAWKTNFPRDKSDDCTAICFFLQNNNPSQAPASS
ncbi:putative protein phosphatase 2C 12 [Silene latifolia]|uniref:putative protein phosphatase 2C 12 n=1 Tax=Silene latifolia TaxID=37657 RepID=UPI003D789CF3